MAFKEISDLSCEVTVSLGGVNKKTGKANPTKVEGYYIGKREVEDRKKKNGVSYIYVFQTQKGNLGVWGKTDLDRKMASAAVGAMTRVTQNGMQATANGDMYKFKVEVDSENTIDVVNPSEANDAASEESSSPSYESASYDGGEEDSMEDEAPLDEVRPTVAARKTATTPDAARQAKVQALLNGSRVKA